MDDWLIPDWPAPPGVQALCSTRAGGVSCGAWQGLNLGARVGDDPRNVAANRALYGRRLGARPVFLEQVHGTRVLSLGAAEADVAGDGAAEHTSVGAQADACTTTERGIACTIMVADCLPVLFTDRAGRRVAAAHAGWRGLAAGVLERSIESFAAEVGAGQLLAWLGPCIGPDAFEVGAEVRAAFVAGAPEAGGCFVAGAAPGKWMADLAGLARQRLRAAGLTAIHGNDGSEAWCTVHNPLRFFSHRRDRVSGRFAASIWLS